MSSYFRACTGRPSPPHGEAAGPGARPLGPSFQGRCLLLLALPFLSTQSMSTTWNSTDTFPLLFPHPVSSRALSLSLFLISEAVLLATEKTHT